jgi:hypothetical protein
MTKDIFEKVTTPVSLATKMLILIVGFSTTYALLNYRVAAVEQRTSDLETSKVSKEIYLAAATRNDADHAEIKSLLRDLNAKMDRHLQHSSENTPSEVALDKK